MAFEILLVEDNESDVLLLSKAFAAAQFASHMTVAGDGEVALDMLRGVAPHQAAARPDLMLVDLHLPKISGHELIETVKADPSLRTIPIIAMSGSSSRADVVGAYERQANAYIVKPMSRAELAETVDNIGRFWFATAKLPREG